jgi:hypothetical protein
VPFRALKAAPCKHGRKACRPNSAGLYDSSGNGPPSAAAHREPGEKKDMLHFSQRNNCHPSLACRAPAAVDMQLLESISTELLRTKAHFDILVKQPISTGKTRPATKRPTLNSRPPIGLGPQLLVRRSIRPKELPKPARPQILRSPCRRRNWRRRKVVKAGKSIMSGGCSGCSSRLHRRLLAMCCGGRRPGRRRGSEAAQQIAGPKEVIQSTRWLGRAGWYPLWRGLQRRPQEVQRVGVGGRCCGGRRYGSHGCRSHIKGTHKQRVQVAGRACMCAW